MTDGSAASGDGKFYVTTPIYYVNFKPHIGTSYSTILTDIACRARRFRGDDALLVTGSDEHSQNIADLAEAAGKSPQAYCDEVIPKFLDCWKLVQIQDYRFERTSDPRHRDMVQKVWQRIYDGGDVFQDTYSGWYHTSDNRYLDPDEVPENPESHPRLKHLSEEAYWFRLSQHQEWLLEFHKANPDFIQPELRRNEVLRRIEGGLNDICISRTSTDWGIPLPWDEGHVFYVWIEALITYMTGSGFDVDAFLETFQDGRSTETRDPLWETTRSDLTSQPPTNYWPADLHVMAKDIPWFHAVIWPAMLHSFGAPPPKKLLVHGYWQFDGEKMSKSLGNVVDPYDAVDLVGVDALRYFLAREVSVGRDGNFGFEGLVHRYKGDLGNDLGNFVHRTLSMLHQLFDGVVPPTHGDLADDLEALRVATIPKVLKAYDELRFSDALMELWELVRLGNQTIARTKPWELKKQPERRDELGGVFARLLDTIRTVVLLAHPVMPQATQRFWSMLRLPGSLESRRSDALDEAFPAGHQVGPSEVVFARLDDAKLDALKGGGDAAAKAASTAAAKDSAKSKSKKSAAKQTAPEGVITIDDFAKVELRVAEVLSAEKVEKADRLLCLKVHDGTRERQIISGIAQWYTTDELPGKRLVLVANLKPAKLRGLLSEGMLLAATDDEGNLALVTPERPIGRGGEVR